MHKVRNKKGEILKSGGIIVKHEENKKYVLLLYRAKHDDWSFPKGHGEVGESLVDSMKREIKEETGLSVQVVKELSPNRYFNTKSKEDTVCQMFLVEPIWGDLSVEHKGDKLEWVSIEEVRDRISHPNLRAYFNQVFKEIINLKYFMLPFLEKFYSLINKGDTVLDLGAGAGYNAKHMSELGAEVIAVDISAERKLDDLPDDIVWKTKSIKNFISESSENDIFDAMFLKCILQELTVDFCTDVLFPYLRDHLKSGGVIGIMTFYKAPNPPFKKEKPSYWTLEQLGSEFEGFEVLYSDMSPWEGSDMDGNKRTFYSTEVIFKK